MRLRTVLELLLVVAVAITVQSGTIGAQSPITALIVPAFIGVALGLLLWLGVLGLHHYRAGRPASPKWIVIFAAEALAVAAAVIFLLARLPSTAPAVTGTVAVVVLGVVMHQAAPKPGWDRDPR